MFVKAHKNLLVFVTMLALKGTAAHAQQCDGQPDGTPCSGDGNECTDDVCFSDVCTHPPEPGGGRHAVARATQTVTTPIHVTEQEAAC